MYLIKLPKLNLFLKSGILFFFFFQAITERLFFETAKVLFPCFVNETSAFADQVPKVGFRKAAGFQQFSWKNNFSSCIMTDFSCIQIEILLICVLCFK